MSYMDIMARGGGIVSTVSATRKASLEELVDSGRKRLDSMLHALLRRDHGGGEKRIRVRS